MITFVCSTSNCTIKVWHLLERASKAVLGIRLVELEHSSLQKMSYIYIYIYIIILAVAHKPRSEAWYFHKCRGDLHKLVETTIWDLLKKRRFAPMELATRNRLFPQVWVLTLLEIFKAGLVDIPKFLCCSRGKEEIVEHTYNCKWVHPF